jgi:hypothetical protein
VIVFSCTLRFEFLYLQNGKFPLILSKQEAVGKFNSE